MSGYSETDAVKRTAPDAPLLAKPFRAEALHKAVRALAPQQTQVVAPERDAAGLFIERRIGSRAVAQAEVDKAEREQPERTEQGRVRVVEREECAVL